MRRLSFPKHKSQGAQKVQKFWNVSDARNDVDVRMWASLSLKQGINAPAAVEPYGDTGALEQAKEVEQGREGHLFLGTNFHEARNNKVETQINTN